MRLLIGNPSCFRWLTCSTSHIIIVRLLRTMRRWDTNTLEFLMAFVGYDTCVLDCACAPCGSIVVGSNGANLKTFNVVDGTMILNINLRAPMSGIWASMSGICIHPDEFAFSCDGSRVTWSYGSFSLEVWNLHSDIVSRMSHLSHLSSFRVETRWATSFGDVGSSCFSPDGCYVFWSQ